MAKAALVSDSWDFAAQCLDDAGQALQADDTEKASQLMFNATDTALRLLAESRSAEFETVDQQIEFADLLDCENGNDSFYMEHLMMRQFFSDGARYGVDSEFDLSDYLPMTVDFVNHLQILSEAAS